MHNEQSQGYCIKLDGYKVLIKQNPPYVLFLLYIFQLDRLRTLTDSDGHQMVDNFRPPCDMKGRKLRKSFA